MAMRAFKLIAVFLLTACAAQMTPERRLHDEVFLDVFWDTARACEGRHGTLTIERVDPEGDVTLRAAAESRSELASFRGCYYDGIRARVERRKQAGLPVPESVNLQPEVDID